MKITCLKVHHVSIPLLNPWVTSYGVEDAIESILIKAHTKDSEAWVETCPLKTPSYSPEAAVSVFHMIAHFFGPTVIGKELPDQNAIPKLFCKLRGNNFAKAGVEQCWWALEAVRTGLPLRRLFGGEERNIEFGDGLGIQASIPALIEKMDQSLKKGIRRMKLKIRPGWDVEVVQSVRSTFPKVRLMVDCNGGYTLKDLALFKALDQLELDMIEQPLDYRDLHDHAVLQNELDTPICLDESITCLRDVEQAIKLKSCRIVNIKIGRVGGLCEAVAIHNLCQKNGIPCWVGGMIESGLGSACNIELATLPNCRYPNEIAVSGQFHSTEIIDPPVALESSGVLAPSSKAYVGRAVLEHRIDEIAIQKIEIT